MDIVASKPPVVVAVKAITDRRLICRATLADGVFPGPLITATKVSPLKVAAVTVFRSCTRQGDKFEINVLNLLTDNTEDLETSIVRISFYFMWDNNVYSLQHWHGIFQRTTNYADGGAFVNQCPIVPFKSFLYEFSGFEQTVCISELPKHIDN
jgi:iron transport multicopper oxidase